MSLKKRAASFRYAFQGVRDLFANQPNARIHLLAAGIAVAAGVYFKISRTDWMAITLCIAMVLSLEAANTAIEHLTNLISPEYHPLAGKAKDAAAGAVLIAAIGSIFVGLIVFLPKILSQ